VHQLGGLLSDGPRQDRMSVADRADGDAGAQVEVTAPVGVEELTAPPADEDDGGGPVIPKHARPRQGNQVGVV
jgi:hypothetical protein